MHPVAALFSIRPLGGTKKPSPQGKWVRWTDGSCRCHQHKRSVLWRREAARLKLKPEPERLLLEVLSGGKGVGGGPARGATTPWQRLHAGAGATNKRRPPGDGVVGPCELAGEPAAKLIRAKTNGSRRGTRDREPRKSSKGPTLQHLSLHAVFSFLPMSSGTE